MSAMQTFYAQLSHASEVCNPELMPLAQLTHVNQAQAQLLKTDVAWIEWPIATE